MTFAGFDSVSPHVGLHSRIALALAHADFDAQAHLQAVSFASAIEDEKDQEDWVKKIIDESPTEWQDLLNNSFPTSLANATAALNGFRHYMIQDATYLEYYYRVRMEAIGKSGTFDEITAFADKLTKSLTYVTGARSDATKKLGVPKDVIATEPKSQELQDSIALYESVVKSGDWLDIHIVLLPCILGYDTIANRLRGKPDTIRNTVYYPLWILANAGGSSAPDYKTFINKSIDSLPEAEREKRWPGWVANFKTACGTEKAFFGLGAKPQLYNVVATDGVSIVKDGIYTIRSYRKDKGYLTPGTPNSVTIKELTADGKWELKNTVEGFSIKNVSKKTYLFVSVQSGTELSYEVSLSSTEQYWSINSIAAYSDLVAQKAYQLLVSGNLQFVLDARSQIANPKVVVTNNSLISDQIWVIEAAA